MLGIILFSLICIYLLSKLVLFLLKHARNRRSLSYFPQLKTNFFLGETSLFIRQPINFHLIQRLNEIAENFKKDKIFLTWLANKPAIFTFNREHVKRLLSKNDPEVLSKGEWLYSGIDDIVPNSLLTVSGDKWKVRRKILSEPFHTTNSDNFVKITNYENKRFINYLKKNECKDVLHEMKKLTLSIFCKLLFEYDVEDEIEETIALANKTTDILVRKALSVFLLSPALYRFTSLANEESQMLKELMNFKNKMLNQKIEISKENLIDKLENNSLNGKSSNLTLIEILLKNFKNSIQEKTSQWSGFEMEEIRSQLDTFIIAGFDTLSAGLTFLLYHLAQYQEYQDKIYTEIQQILGKDSNRELTLEEVKKLTLVEAFVNESLRIQPIAPLISRRITKDITLDEKYTLRAGVDIVIFIEKVLMDPENFTEPHIFRPERFLGDQKDNLYINIPFSGGARDCVAKRTALRILNFVAIDLVRNFKIEFASSTPKELKKSDLKFELVNKPIHAIELKFIERK